jgi:hypothetical protein
MYSVEHGIKLSLSSLQVQVAAIPGQRKYCHILYDIVLWFSLFACYTFG